MKPRAAESIEHPCFVRARHGGKQRRELRIQIAHQLRVERQRLGPGWARGHALHDAREHPREDDDDEVVAKLIDAARIAAWLRAISSTTCL